MISQEQITKFYDDITFPSRTSSKAYENLVPRNLKDPAIGDFGCGQSLFIEVFNRLKYNAIYLDISQNALKTVKSHRKIRASLTKIPLRSECMEVIFCIGTVHHIPDMDCAISELLRVLKVGGILYLGAYSNKTLSAALRNIYDSSEILFIKKIIFYLSYFFIWLKNFRNGLRFRSIEHKKRIDDLLKTPLVRYLPAEYYVRKLMKYSAELIYIKKISSMNIFKAKKI